MNENDHITPRKSDIIMAHPSNFENKVGKTFDLRKSMDFAENQQQQQYQDITTNSGGVIANDAKTCD